MKQFYAQNIYISKTDIKIICIRETTYGPYVLDEPCKTVPLHEKNHLSKHVNDFMETLKKLPKIEDRTSDVWEKKILESFQKNICALLLSLLMIYIRLEICAACPTGRMVWVVIDGKSTCRNMCVLQQIWKALIKILSRQLRMEKRI